MADVGLGSIFFWNTAIYCKWGWVGTGNRATCGNADCIAVLCFGRTHHKLSTLEERHVILEITL